jgi:hypothetical protein
LALDTCQCAEVWAELFFEAFERFVRIAIVSQTWLGRLAVAVVPLVTSRPPGTICTTQFYLWIVTDSAKAAIVGAKVTLRDQDRNQTQTTTTDSSG